MPCTAKPHTTHRQTQDHSEFNHHGQTACIGKRGPHGSTTATTSSAHHARYHSYHRGTTFEGRYRNVYLVLVGAYERLLVVVGEEAILHSEIPRLPARKVFALLHQVTLRRCHTRNDSQAKIGAITMIEDKRKACKERNRLQHTTPHPNTYTCDRTQHTRHTHTTYSTVQYKPRNAKARQQQQKHRHDAARSH